MKKKYIYYSLVLSSTFVLVIFFQQCSKKTLSIGQLVTNSPTSEVNRSVDNSQDQETQLIDKVNLVTDFLLND